MIGKKDEGGLQGVNNVQTFNLSGGQMDDKWSNLWLFSTLYTYGNYVFLHVCFTLIKLKNLEPAKYHIYLHQVIK